RLAIIEKGQGRAATRDSTQGGLLRGDGLLQSAVPSAGSARDRSGETAAARRRSEPHSRRGHRDRPQEESRGNRGRRQTGLSTQARDEHVRIYSRRIEKTESRNSKV